MGIENVKLLDGVDTGNQIFVFYAILGQAYIMSLKDGNNSIIIVGGANSAYDQKITELYPKWTEAIKKSKILLL